MHFALKGILQNNTQLLKLCTQYLSPWLIKKKQMWKLNFVSVTQMILRLIILTGFWPVVICCNKSFARCEIDWTAIRQHSPRGLAEYKVNNTLRDSLETKEVCPLCAVLQALTLSVRPAWRLGYRFMRGGQPSVKSSARKLSSWMTGGSAEMTQESYLEWKHPAGWKQMEGE